MAKSSEKRASILGRLGVESSNGRKGNKYGPNKIGEENLAILDIALRNVSGDAVVVPEGITAPEFGDDVEVTIVPVALTKAQVRTWVMRWAEREGVDATHYADCMVVAELTVQEVPAPKPAPRKRATK